MEKSGRAFHLRRTVQFAETDLASVLHFSNYYRMMEEIEHAFWRSHGMCVIVNGADGQISWPRVATSCEYFAPAHFEDELDLYFVVEHVGERSLTSQVEFLRKGERIARGRTTAVCCRMEGGTFGSIAIPDELRAKLESCLAIKAES